MDADRRKLKAVNVVDKTARLAMVAHNGTV